MHHFMQRLMGKASPGVWLLVSLLMAEYLLKDDDGLTEIGSRPYRSSNVKSAAQLQLVHVFCFMWR